MPPLLSLPRTALHCWGPLSLPSSRTTPLLALASLAGATEDSFASSSTSQSSHSVIDIFSPFSPSAPNNSRHVDTPSPALNPIGHIRAPAKFNSLKWADYGVASGERPLGVIAGGLENGDVVIWDVKAALDGRE